MLNLVVAMRLKISTAHFQPIPSIISFINTHYVNPGNHVVNFPTLSNTPNDMETHYWMAMIHKVSGAKSTSWDQRETVKYKCNMEPNTKSEY